MASAQTVTTIRAYVREYYDLDSNDLPDTLIDRWISEGWGKIVRYRGNWPGFEEIASLGVVGGQPSYSPPIKDIMSIEGPDRKLVFMGHQDAERRFIRGGVREPNGDPVAYSVWRNSLYLWPTPNVTESYGVRGYRAAVNPLDANADAAIDLPHPDASEMLIAWVMYRASIREAESEQAADYRDSFAEGMQLLAKDELDAPAFTPIVLNSQIAPRVGLGTFLPDRLRYDDGWE